MNQTPSSGHSTVRQWNPLLQTRVPEWRSLNDFAQSLGVKKLRLLADEFSGSRPPSQACDVTDPFGGLSRI